MNEILELMKSRRTIRKFTDEQITEADLDLIIEAGLYAPCAGGRQAPIIVASQDRELNRTLGIERRRAVAHTLTPNVKAVSSDQPSIRDDFNIKDAFYGAPTIITIFGPSEFRFTEMDCSVAAENIILACHSLGLGTCYIGSTEESFDNEVGQEFLKKLDFPENYKGYLHIAVGYPAGENPKAKPRKEGRVIKL